MYCSKCGQLIKSDTASFCAYCGARVIFPAINGAEHNRASSDNGKDPVIAEIDLDATVRVDEVQEKKYSLDNRDFVMPEPEEEDVFECTPVQGMNERLFRPVYDNDGVVSGSVNQPDTDATIRGKGAPSVYPGFQGGVSQGNVPLQGINGENGAAMPSYPVSSPVNTAVHSAYPEAFAQAENGPGNFFVQQSPDYTGGAGKKKMKTSTMILLIVLCIILFAAAVAGGIFAADFVIDKLHIDMASEISLSLLQYKNILTASCILSVI